MLDRALEHPGSYRETLIEVIRKVGEIVIERQEYVVVYLREMKHLSEADHDRILRMRQEFDHKVAEFVAAARSSPLVDFCFVVRGHRASSPSSSPTGLTDSLTHAAKLIELTKLLIVED